MKFKKENWDFTLLYFKKYSDLFLFLLLTILLNYFESTQNNDDDPRALSVGYGFMTYRFFSSSLTFCKDKLYNKPDNLSFILEFVCDILLLCVYFLFFKVLVTEKYTYGVIASFSVSIIARMAYRSINKKSSTDAAA